MSTTHSPAEPTEPNATTDHTEPPTAHEDPQVRERRFESGAPLQFATSNHAPLPPAFGDEPWATGEP